MDCDTAGYKKERYDEISNEMLSVLVKVGWKKDFIEKSAPRLPISGWMGDNLLKKSENMGWWSGTDVLCGKETIHVDTLYDYLDKVGRVLAGRVEHGVVKPGEDVIFLPTHTSSNPCN